MTTPNSGLPPRRPFQDAAGPTPVMQSPEFRRFVWLFAIVGFVGIGFALMQYSRTQQVIDTRHAEARKATDAFLPKEALGPEALEARRTALLSKLEGALADTENGMELNRQSSGFFKLLETLIKYSPEEVDRRATLEFDYHRAMKDPDALRGEFVRARGILKKIWAIKLDRPVLGRTDFFRGIMTDGEDPFFVDLTERPPGIEEDGTYDVEGVFYRTVKYLANQPPVMQEHPLLVVRNIHPVKAASETGFQAWLANNALAILAGMAILVFGGRLVFSLVQQGRQQRKRREPAASASFQDMFEKKLRAEGKTPPPPQ